mmetsp:Transcript_29045/g.51970  ORF Transcript_29045/g.51970 Transcript_29045/m.51970 type:complete len:227 (-) Transcript_29045:2985-3665(-)
MEVPVAIFTPGFNPLALELGYALKSDFTIGFWDGFDAMKRNSIVGDGLSYTYLASHSEPDILHTLQAALVFGNVRLLVNVVDYHDFESEDFSLGAISPSVIGAKVSKKIEEIMSTSKVLALQMACQAEIAGLRGHIINIFNFGPSNSLHMSMLQGALANTTKLLSRVLKPYSIRVNTISVQSPQSEILSGFSSVLAKDLKDILKSVALDPSVSSQNLLLSDAKTRL